MYDPRDRVLELRDKVTSDESVSWRDFVALCDALLDGYPNNTKAPEETTTTNEPVPPVPTDPLPPATEGETE